MALAFLNNCIFRAASSGTGSFVHASAITGYQEPDDCTNPSVVDGATYRYDARSDDNSQWEVGYGVYTASTDTLTRATILASSNAGAATSFSAAPSVAMGGALAWEANLPAARYLGLINAGMFMTFDASNSQMLEQANIGGNEFTSIDFGGCTSLIFFQCSGNASCDTITITNCTALLYVLADGCALTEASVDDVLVKLDTYGLSNGSVDLSGGTSAVPSGTGASAKTSLEGKGWTVTVNV